MRSSLVPAPLCAPSRAPADCTARCSGSAALCPPEGGPASSLNHLQGWETNGPSQDPRTQHQDGQKVPLRREDLPQVTLSWKGLAQEGTRCTGCCLLALQG